MADLADENPFACQALLQIAGTRFTTEVPTLAVTLSDEPMLLVNPRFLEENARTEADIRCFLLHEFLHVVLRHTETYEHNSPLLNIALDAVINAIIHRTCGPELSNTFCRLYPPSEVMCLLRTWGNADRNTTRTWKSLHDRIYSGAIAADDLHELLQALQGVAESPNGILLIGNHATDRRVSQANAKRLDEILKRMTGVRIWNHREGPGQSDRLQRLVQRITNTRIEAWHSETARLIDEVLQPDPTRIGDHPTETRLPILSPGDRRAFATLRKGGILPFSRHLLNGRSPDETARVYLDTSGSMDNVLQQLVALLAHFQHRIRLPLHVFSNRVADARIENGRLKYDSTGGTSISCVFDHIREQKAGKCLIVTDGYVENIDKQMLRDIPLSSLRVLVTADGSTSSFEKSRIPCHRLKTLDI